MQPLHSIRVVIDGVTCEVLFVHGHAEIGDQLLNAELVRPEPGRSKVETIDRIESETLPITSEDFSAPTTLPHSSSPPVLNI